MVSLAPLTLSPRSRLACIACVESSHRYMHAIVRCKEQTHPTRAHMLKLLLISCACAAIHVCIMNVPAETLVLIHHLIMLRLSSRSITAGGDGILRRRPDFALHSCAFDRPGAPALFTSAARYTVKALHVTRHP
jgi:hypothetical protein